MDTLAVSAPPMCTLTWFSSLHILSLVIMVNLETDEPNLESVDSADPNVENVEPNVDIVEPSLGVATDCSSTEGGDENDSGSSAYESDELEFFANQMRVNINYQLLDYKELDGCMTFKDIPGARKCMKLYALANKKELQTSLELNMGEGYIFISDMQKGLLDAMNVSSLPKANHRGDKFWKIDPSQAMEPPQIVKLASRPKVKRNRAKDEAINR
ncbi:hypothetical protein K7X08_003390 [Anisodus acutangulus]|uniref:Uncharacterized protein n=1 Tax=Anisodus acutangulus TaxID=402998 RepID=A0A9Q1RIR3_9SOLA|nr:hypothetical protein K7X08_003390 [Anisodus acutangulus]